METPYTQRRAAQYRGPSTSDDYNRRIEENYQDLVVLFNRARLSEVELAELYRRMAKDHLSMVKALEDLEGRVGTLEAAAKRFTFHTESQIDNARFDGDVEFEIPASDRLSFDTTHGIVTLPKIVASSRSKLFYTNTAGEEVIPSTLETLVVGTTGTADSGSAVIDSSDPTFALYRKAGLIWERNVIVSAADADGAEMTLYVRVPTDLFTTDKANAVFLHPFPYFGTTIRDISYTLTPDPFLQESDGYTTFNTNENYAGEADARGWVVPGGWTGVNAGADAAVSTGPRAYYFEPKPITALRIKLHQPNYHREAAQFVYTYGLSHLDLRYDKFTSEGRAMIRFDAPNAQTISSITDVQPQIWNVSEADLSKVFSWRVIWETSNNSGVYTETPVANSSKVWIEVTLKDTDGWTPALSGLTVAYT